MLSRIRDYFGMSQREARGFIVLLCLTALLLISPFFTRFFFSSTQPDTAATDQQKLDSLLAIMQTTEQANSRNPYDKTLADHYAEPSSRSSKRFNFDPNTISIAQWQELGLPGWLAERIGKYRSKGGQFRRKEDLLRIYGFPTNVYQELEPYIVLETTAEKKGTPFADRDHLAFERVEPTEERRVERAKPTLQPFDINTVDTTQLIRLKGIGSKLAGRIIKFRDALGGFVTTDQYADIFGLDSLALAELQHYGKIQSPVHKININTASAEELDRHVYLSRRQAEIIVRYREQHGAFTSLEALRPIRVLDTKTIEKLGPYLSF